MKSPSFRLCVIVFFALLCPLSLAQSAQAADAREQLKDSSPQVRCRAALALAKANDADAIPVLIDLLAELPAGKRQAVEEFLNKLAGEWAPISQLPGEDSIARKIRHDAWVVWWRNTNGQALLAVLDEHILTPARRQKVKRLIAQLGDDEFPIREAATAELSDLGRIALPQLRTAMASTDLEIMRRARELIERIEQDSSRRLPSAAVRLLALRKPPSAAEALLAYLPLAEQDNLGDDVKKSLAVLAIRDGKLDAALVRGLAEESPSIRAVAAEALVKGGGREGCAAVRNLLQDKTPLVRLRVALALVMAGERDGVPVLIDLLPVVSDEQIGEVEDALHQLAGDSAPDMLLGTEQADKKKCRDAWAAWWKLNGGRIDLARFTARTWHGYTLLCDTSRNRVFEIDRQGKERWAVEGVPFPVDAWVIGGNRVLIAEYSGRKISERDLHGKVLWSKGLTNLPVNVQRLANGNTFIATLNQILEVDRAGNEIYQINNIVGGITAAYRARDGRIICLASAPGQCLVLDTTGKCLQQFASNRNATWTSGIDLLPGGHILITQPNRNKVTEYDRNGKSIVEVNAPEVTTATGLPNGHFLLASSKEQRAYEVDRKGKIIWEYKGGGNIFRARRR